MEKEVKNKSVKPANYWTYERCKEEALKYDKISYFQKNSGSAYNSSVRNKWLEEITTHMIQRNGEVKNYWTKEKCHEISINYKSRTRFLKEHSPVYRIAEKNGWLDEIFSHILKRETIKPKNYWTKELVYQEALKYNKKSDFEKGCLTAYHLMRKKGWVEEMTKHMKEYKIPKNYWEIYENCLNEALKYSSKTVFRRKNNMCVKISKKNGWYDIITSHMEQVGDLYKRLVYVYEFSDKTCYVGLTYNKAKRHIGHTNSKNSPVFLHKEKTGLEPIHLILSEYIEATDAQQLEHDTIEKYRKFGWNILNKGKTGKNTGSLGGKTLKKLWDNDKCKDDIIKYKSYIEFKNNSKSCLRYIKKHKLFQLLEYFNDYKMVNKKPKYYWDNKINCIKEISKYSSIKNLRKYSSTCYTSLLRNKWLKELTSDLYKFGNDKYLWEDLKYCEEKIKSCKTKSEFIKKFSYGYKLISKKNWFEDMCFHMKVFKKPNGYWKFKENCKLEAIKYKTRMDFLKNCSRGYENSRINKWLDEFYPDTIDFNKKKTL